MVYEKLPVVLKIQDGLLGLILGLGPVSFVPPLDPDLVGGREVFQGDR